MALAVLILIILIFVCFSKLKKLESRIQTLEKGSTPVQAQATSTTAQQRVASAVPPVQTAQTFTPTSETKSQEVAVPPAPENAFVQWLQEDTMMKIGASLLLLALGWFVSYSFANNWIGETGRIFLGLATGVTFLGAGVWRIKEHIHQGGILTVVGATTVLLTLFAARGIYNFFTPESALAMMFATIAFVAFVSVRYDSQTLALGGLILASIAPFLTNVPNPDVSGLFFYLLIVILGTLWVVWRTGWCTLTFASLLIALVYSTPFLFNLPNVVDRDIALLYAFLFTAIFFIANVISLIFRKGESYAQAHIYTALGTGIYLVSWVLTAADRQWQSLLLIAWALVFMVGSYIVYMYTTNRTAFFMYGATSVVLIGSATAVELSGAVLVIAYTLEALVMLTVASFLRSPSEILGRLSFVFAIPIALSLNSFVSSSWNTGVFHKDSATLLVLFLSLLVAGLIICKRKTPTDLPEIATVMRILFTVSAGYAVSIVWLVTHALAVTDVGATVLSLIIYTIAGISMMIASTTRQAPTLRTGGIVLIALVVARLLLVEIWNLSMGGKITVFFVIGLLLIGAAIYQKNTQKKQTIQTNLTE